jgi:hypothetical protein
MTVWPTPNLTDKYNFVGQMSRSKTHENGQSNVATVTKIKIAQSYTDSPYKLLNKGFCIIGLYGESDTFIFNTALMPLAKKLKVIP